MFLSVIHQQQLQTNIYRLPPSYNIQWLKASFIHFVSSFSLNIGNVSSLLVALSNFLAIRIIAYSGNDRFIYVPHSNENVHLTAQIYCTDNIFDSVLHTIPQLIINDLIPDYNKDPVLKIATWNLRGANSIEKRSQIDFVLHSEQLSVIAVQETHLRSSFLATPNFYWRLGPQYQTHASRGLGFLIAKAVNSYVIECVFVTPNLGFLRIRLPFTTRDLVIINVHKLSNGSCESTIETGNFNLLCLNINSLLI